MCVCMCVGGGARVYIHTCVRALGMGPEHLEMLVGKCPTTAQPRTAEGRSEKHMMDPDTPSATNTVNLDVCSETACKALLEHTSH